MRRSPRSPRPRCRGHDGRASIASTSRKGDEQDDGWRQQGRLPSVPPCGAARRAATPGRLSSISARQPSRPSTRRSAGIGGLAGGGPPLLVETSGRRRPDGWPSALMRARHLVGRGPSPTPRGGPSPRRRARAATRWPLRTSGGVHSPLVDVEQRLSGGVAGPGRELRLEESKGGDRSDGRR